MHILSNAENILLDQKDEQSNVLMVVVRRYLAEHYDTGTLHELAAQIGYTPSSLSRMIKNIPALPLRKYKHGSVCESL